ncbi:MAG TPA: hypothetical protein RMG95_15425, partial [Polyangiaceae bacterium LLY-WYZ-15_(1-7)]|nr:hypothetical protein [Polyangiaceae bacterium LLY-WYZ-15_(1-7)]
AAGEAGYRESRGRWVLTGTEARPVELGPVGSPRVPRTDRRRLLSGIGLGLVAFAALFLALPAATERATRAADGDTPEVDAVLAATPFRRRALARLTTAAARAPRSEASVARWTALVDRTHGCDGVAQTLVEAGRPERAIEAAETCPRLHAQLAKVRGEYALARFADAVQTFRATPVTDDDLRWSPTKGLARPGRDGEAYARDAARAQLTQHRWRSAARALEPLYGPGPRCAADAARGRSGEEPEWLDRDDPVCRVLWADEEARERGIWVGSESGRRALVGGGILGGFGLEVGLPDTRTERGALAARVETLRRLADAGAEGDLTGFGPAELLLPTSAVCPLDGASVPALEAEALSADRPDVLPALRVRLLLRRALFEATTLRPARAEALLARARVIAAEEGGSPVEVERVAETVRLWREGPRESAERRVGLAPRMGSLAGLHVWEPHAALREDATLAERLRHAPRPGMAPFRSLLCHAAGLARAAEVIGAADVAERERGVVERLRAALEDRDIALMLWSVDSMPRY